MKYNKTSQNFAQNSQNPGPGTYNMNDEIIQKASIKFPLSSRIPLYQSQNVPGPGNYKIVGSETVSKTAPQWVFGTGKREEEQFQEKRKFPGPGTYQLNSLLQTNKGFTMFSKTKDGFQVEAAKVPGPGTYNDLSSLHKTKKSLPSYRMGTAPRDGNNSSSLDRLGSSPGPGQYFNPKLQSSMTQLPAYKMGTSQRQDLNKNEKTPGPGTYDQKTSLFGGPKIVISGGQRNTHKVTQDNTPGPGNYNPDLSPVKLRPLTTKIGTSTRESLNDKALQNGPGYYNIGGKFKGPTWVFNRSPRSKSQQASMDPGPGAYNIPPKFADVPKYLLSNSAMKH